MNNSEITWLIESTHTSDGELVDKVLLTKINEENPLYSETLIRTFSQLVDMLDNRSDNESFDFTIDQGIIKADAMVPFGTEEFITEESVYGNKSDTSSFYNFLSVAVREPYLYVPKVLTKQDKYKGVAVADFGTLAISGSSLEMFIKTPLDTYTICDNNLEVSDVYYAVMRDTTGENPYGTFVRDMIINNIECKVYKLTSVSMITGIPNFGKSYLNHITNTEADMRNTIKAIAFMTNSELGTTIDMKWAYDMYNIGDNISCKFVPGVPELTDTRIEQLVYESKMMCDMFDDLDGVFKYIQASCDYLICEINPILSLCSARKSNESLNEYITQVYIRDIYSMRLLRRIALHKVRAIHLFMASPLNELFDNKEYLHGSLFPYYSTYERGVKHVI